METKANGVIRQDEDARLSPAASTRPRKRRKQSRAPVGCGTLVKHGKFFHARWRVNGKLVSKSLKTEDEAVARAELARLSVPRSGLNDRAALRKIATVMSSTLEDVAEANRVASIPVADLFKLFAAAPNRAPVGVRTLSVYGGQFSVFSQWIARRHPEITNARDISQGVADEYAQWRRDSGKSPNTVNKDLNLFAQAWRILSVRYALAYNPWTEDHIARGKLQPNRRRNLTADECKAVLAAASTEERAAIQVSLCCAFRLGDVVRLRWSDVDLDGRWISKVQHKTGRLVSVPLADPVTETLLEWRKARPDDPLFFKKVLRFFRLNFRHKKAVRRQPTAHRRGLDGGGGERSWRVARSRHRRCRKLTSKDRTACAPQNRTARVAQDDIAATHEMRDDVYDVAVHVSPVSTVVVVEQVRDRGSIPRKFARRVERL